MDPSGCVEAGKRTDHEDVTVGEVDELQEAIDHAVAESDQGVDRSQGKSIDQLLEELMHGNEEKLKAEKLKAETNY
jgi:hypothetical protein